MTTDWESAVHADPDGVDVAALFRDAHADDGRRAYEGVVGLYWLAEMRPTRLIARHGDLLALLGTASEFSYGDGPGATGTRHWAFQAVGEFLCARPEFAPDAFELAGSGDRRTRVDAFRALSHAADTLDTRDAGRRPPLAVHFSRRFECLAAAVEPESPVAGEALLCLSGVVPWHREGSRDVARSLLARPDGWDRPDGWNCLVGTTDFLARVALFDAAVRPDAVEAFLDWIGRRAGAGTNGVYIPVGRLDGIVRTHQEAAPRVERRLDALLDCERPPARRNLAGLLGRLALAGNTSTADAVEGLLGILAGPRSEHHVRIALPTALDELRRVVERRPGTAPLVAGHLDGLVDHEHEPVRERARELRALLDG